MTHKNSGQQKRSSYNKEEHVIYKKLIKIKRNMKQRKGEQNVATTTIQYNTTLLSRNTNKRKRSVSRSPTKLKKKKKKNN